MPGVYAKFGVVFACINLVLFRKKPCFLSSHMCGSPACINMYLYKDFGAIPVCIRTSAKNFPQRAGDF